MAFFKKYNGTTDLRLLRLERVIWILIYGGLLSTVLSGFARDAGAQTATWEAQKQAERSARAETGTLAGIAVGLPALTRALPVPADLGGGERP
jgi:hypothetical protein